MNRLQLKALLLSVLTEIKFGQALDRGAARVKREFKQMVGLKRNASNLDVVKEIQRVYKENKLEDDFNGCLERLKMSDILN